MALSNSNQLSSTKGATGMEEDTRVDDGVDGLECFQENSENPPPNRVQTSAATSLSHSQLPTTRTAAETSALALPELNLDVADVLRESKTLDSAETTLTATSGDFSCIQNDTDSFLINDDDDTDSILHPVNHALKSDRRGHGSQQRAHEDEEDPELVGAFSVRATMNGTLEVLPAIMYTGTSEISPQNTNSSLLVSTVDAFTVNEQEEAQRLKDAEEQGREQGRQSVLRNAVDAEVVVPQLFTKQHFQMPTFTPENEKRFRVEHNHLLMSALVIFRPLAMSLNMTFFLWDAIQPDAPLLSCFLVITSSLLVFYGITKIAEKNPMGKVQPVMCLANLIISSQIATKLFLIPDGFVVGAGSFGLILVPGCCSLRFWYALVFCTGTACIGNALAIASHFVNSATASHELYYVLIQLNMFVGTYCLFALFLSYMAELHLRQRFRDSGTIFSWSDGTCTTNSPQMNDQLQEMVEEHKPPV